MSTISLCMVVKNDEKMLARCLRSVEGIPDEIIIVDTGSEDSSKEIASTFESQVFDFKWIDDFSAVRNYSFEQATMDYILWLDADEMLLPEDRTKLHELKNILSPRIDAVSMNYHVTYDHANNVTQSAKRFRLIRRSKNFVWVGTVHEELVAEDAFHYFDSDIVVTHEKTTSESGPSKRNMLPYEDRPKEGRETRPAQLFHNARELEINNEFEKAILYYLEFLERKEADLDLTLFALDRLARCYYMLGNLEKEWECTLKSVELDIPRPEFSCRFGERFLKRNQFRQAIFWYELALQDPGNNASDRMGQNYPFKTWLPHKQLGLCYYRVGDYKRALSHNQLALQYLPHDPDIDKNIRVLEKLTNESTDKVQAEEGFRRSSLVQRYLDLLESALIGMLIQDTPDDWRPGSKFDPEMRRLGRDWPSLSFSMIGSVRMRNLRYACETVLLDGVEGDFIETGVWRGGACILMRGILEAHDEDTRRVFVADSFAGLPPPDLENFPLDAKSRLHTLTQLQVTRADVEDNFRRFGLLDERVVFIEGWFKDTLSDAPIDQLAVLRLDGDMYESTIEALEALYHKVSYGGFVIIDDYHLSTCAQAVHDFRDRYGITSPILPIDGWATYWRIDHKPIR